MIMSAANTRYANTLDKELICSKATSPHAQQSDTNTTDVQMISIVSSYLIGLR